MDFNATALRMYNLMEMTESAMHCYVRMGRTAKAKELLNEAIAEAEGVDNLKAANLMCILGDIEKDISFYERAWELSNRKSSRAARSLGEHYFFKEEVTLHVFIC